MLKTILSSLPRTVNVFVKQLLVNLTRCVVCDLSQCVVDQRAHGAVCRGYDDDVLWSTRVVSPRDDVWPCDVDRPRAE